MTKTIYPAVILPRKKTVEMSTNHSRVYRFRFVFVSFSSQTFRHTSPSSCHVAISTDHSPACPFVRVRPFCVRIHCFCMCIITARASRERRTTHSHANTPSPTLTRSDVVGVSSLPTEIPQGLLWSVENSFCILGGIRPKLSCGKTSKLPHLSSATRGVRGRGRPPRAGSRGVP